MSSAKHLFNLFLIFFTVEAAVMSLFAWRPLPPDLAPFEKFLDPLLMVAVALPVAYYLVVRRCRQQENKAAFLGRQLPVMLQRVLMVSLDSARQEDFHAQLLKMVVEESGISLQKKGGLFLLEKGEMLLKAHIGFGKEQLQSCRTLMPGKCLCGKVMATGKLVYASRVDARHDVRYAGMPDHGHYCLPIKSAESVVGVLNLYVEAGHRHDPVEAAFLESVCVLFAKVIEYKQLERKTLQMQKMESLSRVAAAISHDFNNIIGVIQGTCDVMKKSPVLSGQNLEDLGSISEAAGRGADLARQLLDFSRKRTEEMVEVDFLKLVTGMSDMLHRVLGKEVELETDIPESLPALRASPGQLQQVLLNLAVNARDAMDGRGRMRISARGPEAQGARQVRVTVEDNGPGMTAEVLAHVFEPFFTTKPEGKGTGLGLSTAYSIIRQHGGDIQVYSEEGSGTRFEISFPV